MLFLYLISSLIVLDVACITLAITDSKHYPPIVQPFIPISLMDKLDIHKPLTVNHLNISSIEFKMSQRLDC